MEYVSRTLPAGVYFVGDPCYAFDITWDALLLSRTGDGNVVAAQCGEHSFVAAYTAFGDGAYRDSENRFVFGVDAAMIGVVAVDAVDHVPFPGEMWRRTFPEPFTVSENNGVITIGDLVVDTTGNN